MDEYRRPLQSGTTLVKIFSPSRTETSSEVIAGHGGPIDSFVPGQLWASADAGLAIAGSLHFFFLVVAGSALTRDGIIILGTVHLALLALFPHFFKAYEGCKMQPSAYRNHSGPNFLKNSTH